MLATSNTTGQTLAELLNQGQPSPNTPAEAAVAGASPDAAKMTGTPAQQKAATRRAVESQDTLRAARQQGSGTVSGERDAEADALGQFARADEAIARKAQESLSETFGTLTTALPTSSLSVKEDVLKARLDRNSPQYEQNLQQARSNLATLANPAATDAEKQVALRQLSGTVGTPDRPFTGAEELAQFFQAPTPSELIQKLDSSKALARGFPMAKLSDDDWRSLGFTDSVSAANTLGLTVDGLRALNWEDVKVRVEEVRQTKYLNTERLTNTANNALLPPSVREDARAQLRSFGLIGRRAQEEKLNNIQQQMQDGDTVTLPNGAAVPVSEIVSDANLLAVVNDALQKPEVLNKLKTDERSRPFAEWIEKNAIGVSALVEPLRAQIAEANRVFRTNKELVGNPPADVLAFLLPEYAKAPATSGQIAEIPNYLAIRKNLNGPQQAQLDAVMQELVKRAPSTARAYANMDISNLRDAGIFVNELSEIPVIKNLRDDEFRSNAQYLPKDTLPQAKTTFNTISGGKLSEVERFKNETPQERQEILKFVKPELRDAAKLLFDSMDNDASYTTALAQVSSIGLESNKNLALVRELPAVLNNAQQLRTKEAEAQRIKEAEEKAKAAEEKLRQAKLAQEAELKRIQAETEARVQQQARETEAQLERDRVYGTVSVELQNLLNRDGQTLLSSADYKRFADAAKNDERLRPAAERVLEYSRNMAAGKADSGSMPVEEIQNQIAVGGLPSNALEVTRNKWQGTTNYWASQFRRFNNREQSKRFPLGSQERNNINFIMALSNANRPPSNEELQMLFNLGNDWQFMQRLR
jgi:hypothetical protein